MASLHLAQQILDIIYPVGSIYLSTDFTNPSKKFGGTWVQVSGGYLYAAVGGSGITKGTHSGPGNGTNLGSTVLTIDQMPRHNHSVMTNIVHQDGTQVHEEILDASIFYGDGRRRLVSNCGYNGSSKGHTHTIDLVDCYMWKRTK